MLMWNRTLPFLGYSGLMSKIGISKFRRKNQKSQFLDHLMETNQIFKPIFGISIKKLPYPEIFEKILTTSSRKKLGLLVPNLSIFAINLKQLITPDLVNIFSFWKQIRILQKIWWGDNVFCFSKNVLIFSKLKKTKKIHCIF